MSEESNIQLSDKVNGTLINVRADSAEELAELVAGLVEKADEIVTKFSSFKEVFVAKGILTQSEGRSGGTFKGSESNAAATSGEGGTPTCKHGPMKDLRSKNYKSDFYCTESDRDKQCKPVKL